MNENLLTLKQIADQIGVNYRTLVSCKNRFEGFVHGVPVGRIARYPEDFVDFFRLVFALFDEGYTTGKVQTLLLKGVEAEEDAFIESWLEEWRVNLKLALPDQEEGAATRMNERTDGRTEEVANGPLDEGTDGPLDGRTDEPMDGLTDEAMDGVTDGRMDGPLDGRTDGGTDERTDGLTDEPMNGLTDEGMNGSMDGGTDERVDGRTDEKMTRYLDEKMKAEFSDQIDHIQQAVSEILREFSCSLERILQKMATQSNIAITALCEASEDIHKSILALDTRMTRMEKGLDMEEAGPLELYQVAAENYQVDLPVISLPVFQDQDQDSEDDLSPVKESITDGIPDREKVVEWILTRREEDLQANSYSALATILNEAEIPTMSGRNHWARSTVRNLIVRKKAEQG